MDPLPEPLPAITRTVVNERASPADSSFPCDPCGSPLNPDVVAAFSRGDRQYRFERADADFLNLPFDEASLRRVLWGDQVRGLVA